eukprot:COSAG06_NODE_3113_length_5840_cov_57.375719_2_plen_103_part_00
MQNGLKQFMQFIAPESSGPLTLYLGTRSNLKSMHRIMSSPIGLQFDGQIRQVMFSGKLYHGLLELSDLVLLVAKQAHVFQVLLGKFVSPVYVYIHTTHWHNI